MPTSPVPDSGAARRAVAPQPTPEALRGAYLGLLKLSLCDLAGAGTQEVRWTHDRRVFSRTLTDAQQLRHRMEGKDWPLDGLTMVGLDRLDDLQECVDSIIADGVAGDLIEAGAWRGGASILIRAALDSLGAYDRTLWVADSFRGFRPAGEDDPAADREVETEMSRIAHLAPTLPVVREYFARFGLTEGVRFVPGYFEDTMDSLRGRSWSLVRLDADTYRPTKLALDVLYPGLEAGGYLVADDYFHPYLPESCRRAIDDFRSEHSITEPIEQIDWSAGRWRKLSPAQPPRSQPPAPPEAIADPQSRPPHDRIPTDRELQMSDDITALQAQLRSAQSALRERAAGPRERLLRLTRRGVRRF